MINMEYEIWKDTCTAFLDLNNSITSKYLQLYPFILLTDSEKERLISEEFFNIYIKGGAVFANLKVFDTPNRYLQKSDGSFRITKLISPILYLYLLSIGTQISKEYKSSRKNARVYHSGNISELYYHYKKSYDNYYADINESQEVYSYFIKVDLTNFYDSININELFEKINKDREILDPRTTLIYKNILNMIGNEKYPIVENNAALSYLATEVYLDETDSAIEKFLSGFNLLDGFQLVRYVDDLFIFFNCENEIFHNATTEIKNELINIYSKSGLSMNEKKFKYDKTENIHSLLKSALYDFYVNGFKMDFGEFYNSEDLVQFFNNLITISDNHSHTLYKHALKTAFEKEGINYSEEEILNYFLFYQSKLFENKNVKNKVKQLIVQDYKIFKYSIKDMVMAVCNTSDGVIIKSLLNKIFDKHNSNNIDIFDEAIIISYLINRSFTHIDLRKALLVINDGVSNFIEYNCRSSFFKNFEDEIKYNNLYSSNEQNYYLLIEDKIIWFQFFMFNYYEKMGRYLESYAYLKVFFDRFIAHIMNCTGIDTSGSKNKPNINAYYKEAAIIKGLKSLGVESVHVESVHQEPIEDIIKKAHLLRNQNPINHSSSTILNSSHISSFELLESKESLIKIINLCLDRCNLKSNIEDFF